MPGSKGIGFNALGFSRLERPVNIFATAIPHLAFRTVRCKAMFCQFQNACIPGQNFTLDSKNNNWPKRESGPLNQRASAGNFVLILF
jgi:hypothetical protein